MRSHPSSPERDALATPAVSADDHLAAGQQRVRGADDAIDRALPGSVTVIKKVFGLGVVDGDHRQLEYVVLFHGSQPDHPGCCLFHAGNDIRDQSLAVGGAKLGCPGSDFRVKIVKPIERDEDHGAHQVGTVVHRHVGQVLQRGGDVPVIAVLVLALDGEHGNAVILHQAGGDVVLGG